MPVRIVRGMARGPAAGNPLAWTSGVIVVAVVLLIAFNAASLRNWTSQQPAGPVTLVARRIVESWWALTSRLGLGAPREAVAELWRAARAAHWR